MAEVEPTTKAPPDAQAQLALLSDLTRGFASSLDIDDTLKVAIGRICDHLGAAAGSVFLLDADTDQLVCRACFGPVDVLGLRLDLKAGLVGQTATESRSIIVQDAASDPRFSEVVDANTGFQTRSVMCAPLKTADHVIGVLEVLNKVDNSQFDTDDLTLLDTLAAPTALSIHNAMMAGDLVQQQRIRKELKLARRVQRSLLPEREPPPFPILGVNLPAREVSGDFYDHFKLPDGRIGFTIGDVSGKGVDAAFLMVRVTTLLRWAGKEGQPPRRWLKRVNEEMCEMISGGMFVCAAAGYYDPARRLLTFANAGLPPVLVDDGQSIEALIAGAPPLGIVSGLQFEEHQLQMDSKAAYFTTDGVVEARYDNGQLGVDGLKAMIRDLADQLPRPRLGQMVWNLREHTLNDDTTILLIDDPIGDVQTLASIGFHASCENLKLAREVVADAVAQATTDCPHCVEDHLLLVVNEAIANVIRHAYRNDPDGRIELTIYERRGKLIFYLRDYAPRVDVSRIKPRDLSDCRPGGLGVNFIDSVMDSWVFTVPEDGAGNLLIMTKDLRRSAQTGNDE
ncbi:MAG: hypothetical protein DHS20C11_12930 [Lysobacteraceae bacterium]|nr:MAG: hypothetical protein DHS20C11_12930 [Xanthomonadaceae bacterium]